MRTTNLALVTFYGLASIAVLHSVNTATAQGEISEQQTAVITALATTMVATEVCGHEVNGRDLNGMLDYGRFPPGGIATVSPYRERLAYAMQRADTIARHDRTRFCDMALEQLGPGSTRAFKPLKPRP